MIEKKEKATHQATSQHQCKGSHLSEEEQTFQAFFDSPKTMKMVEVQLGIDRANQCRYIAKLRKQDRVAVVRHGYCPITHHWAGFLTTNPALFPNQPEQLSLFPEKGGIL